MHTVVRAQVQVNGLREHQRQRLPDNCRRDRIARLVLDLADEDRVSRSVMRCVVEELAATEPVAVEAGSGSEGSIRKPAGAMNR